MSSDDGEPISIAITGTEGAGKTVFVTTFAKHLQLHASEWKLEPLSAVTQQYVERQWNILQNGDWPEATEPGTAAELSWRLRLPPKDRVTPVQADIAVIDPAGHDFRRVYVNDAHILSIAQLPEELQDLARSFRHADILLVLVNLKDFLGEPNAERRINSDLALKFALDAAKSSHRPRRICVVLTQSDQFPYLVTSEAEWRGVLQKWLPTFSAAHLLPQTTILLTSAVDRTHIVMDPDGRSRQIPQNGFRSQGYDKLLSWLDKSISDLDADRRLNHIYHVVGKVLGIGIASFCAIWFFGKIIGAIGGYFEAPKPVFTTTLSHQKRVEGSFFQDTYYDPVVTVTIKNEGGSGNVAFNIVLFDKAAPEFLQEHLKRGEIKQVQRHWKDLHPDDEPYPYHPRVETVR